jgi:hypothetical protein
MAEVGKGSNQLADYKPVERAIEADAAMQERKAIKKDEEAKARQKELMDKLAQMQGKAIMSHDTTGIAEQQQDLKDTVMKNIDAINKGGAGAVEAELAVNQKIATLNQNINSSVAKRQSVEALAKDMQANPNRYTKKSRKNVEDFIINGGMVKNPDGTWAVNPYDETQLAEPSTDLQAELKATRDALRETSPKTKKGYTLPDGTYVESETYNTSLEDVKDDKGNIIQPGVHSTLRQMYADNERVRNKAHELFEDESDDVKKQYTDPTTGEVDAAKYFAEKFASQVGHTETSRTSRTPQGKSEGAMKREEETSIHVEIEPVKGSAVSGGKPVEQISTTMRKANGQPLSYIDADGSTISLGTIFTDKSGKQTAANGTRTLNKQELKQNDDVVRANVIRETNIEQGLRQGLDEEQQAALEAANQPLPLPNPNASIPIKIDKTKVDKIIEFNQRKEGGSKKTLEDIHKGNLPKGYTSNDKRAEASGTIITKSYSPQQEENINIVLKNPKNKGITRVDAIKALGY